MSQSSTPREEKDVKEEMLEHTGAVLAYSAEPTALVRPAKVFNAEEEKALYRRIDLRIMPILAVLYLLSFMDRGNIGNARLFGLETDLKMQGFDYSIALTAYFCTYSLFEVPANLMLKKLRPSLWLSSITVAWGIVMTLMGVVNSFGGLVACRLALGIAEAGLFPGVVLYITLWFPRNMVQLRIAMFFAAATIAGAFSGLLAYAIGFMGGVANYNAWRWIFILEGIATVLVGIGAYWAISDLPAEAKFLTEDERAWVIFRKKSDNSTVGEAENITPGFIWMALTDWQVWISVIYFASILVSTYSIGLFLPTIIKSFGTYTTPQVQLLTVPVYLVACSWVIVSAYLSDKYQKRYIFVIFDQALSCTGFIINISPAPAGVKYFGLFLCATGTYAGVPSAVTWLGNNLSGQTKRGVGMATQIGMGNLGGIVASNVYRSVDAPRYFLGHGTVIGFFFIGMIASTSYAILLKRANAKKAAYLAHQDSLPEDQKRVYTVQELRLLGDRAPDFVYTI